MKVKDELYSGGPAFPDWPESAFPSTFKSSDPETGQVHRWGMTLRDEFAKAALPAVIAHWAECIIEDQKREGDDTITGLQLYRNKGGSPLGIASDAYAIADAMMEARK